MNWVSSVVTHLVRSVSRKLSTNLDFNHTPVLLREVSSHILALNCSDDFVYYVDATVGGGGYTFELLSRNPKAVVLCIDRDKEVS